MLTKNEPLILGRVFFLYKIFFKQKNVLCVLILVLEKRYMQSYKLSFFQNVLTPGGFSFQNLNLLGEMQR